MATINYSVCPMKNPGDSESIIKYYAKFQARGEVNLDKIASDIGYSTSLTEGDVLNVLRSLIKQVRDHLMEGEIVKLENFGTFQLQLRSDGQVEESAFVPRNIREIRMQYRPGKLFAQARMPSMYTFRKVATLKKGGGSLEDETTTE